MTIDEAIAQLERIKAKHGNINCESDCPRCGCSFPVGRAEVAPETVRLNQSVPALADREPTRP